MELISDNLSVSDTGIPGGEVVDQIGNILKGFGGSIAHKAQLKSGLSYIQSGDLSKLTGAQLDRLIEANTPPSLYIKSPVYIARIAYPMQVAFRAQMTQRIANENGASITTGTTGLNADGSKKSQIPTDIKKYIPWILGAIVIVVLIYFIIK